MWIVKDQIKQARKRPRITTLNRDFALLFFPDLKFLTIPKTSNGNANMCSVPSHVLHNPHCKCCPCPNTRRKICYVGYVRSRLCSMSVGIV